MKTPRISIIIPIYNAEKYLKKCLNSVVEQTLTDIEIFCVDDGSTDDSWGIIQEFAKRDSRIVAIRQKNAGAAVARNKGLEAAKGEYIGFVDSDDYVDRTYFEHLYRVAKEQGADIARAYVKAEFDKSASRYSHQEDVDYETYYYNDLLKDDVLKNKLSQRHVIWLAIFKRSMIKRHHIIFPSEIRTGQDVLFNIKTGYFADKIVYVEQPTYYHRVVRGGSLITDFSYSDKGLLSRSLVMRENVKFLNSRIRYDRSVYINHMLDAMKFLSTRMSHIKDRGVAREIVEIVVDAWRRTKYKKEISAQMGEVNKGFVKVLDSVDSLTKYINAIAYIDQKRADISVVMPVYNQEKYLDQCIVSVQTQTLKNIEIICVDDGSTDKSRNIIERYARKDRRITVINKDNGGVSTARNAGFDVAKGKYVIFLDSDDFFEPTLLERLYDRIEQTGADIVACNFKSYFESMQKYSDPRINFAPLGKRKIVSYKTSPDDLFSTVTLMFWNKLFRTDFLRRNKIRNDESLHRAQDIEFVGRALICTEKVAYVDEPLVSYRTDTENSNVRRTYKYPFDVITALEQFKETLDAKKLYKEVERDYIKIATDHLLASLYFTETYEVHRDIHEKAKKFLRSLDVQKLDQSYFSGEKPYVETQTLVTTNYEGWLRYRITDLHDDRDAKYISYLLGEFQRKYEDEVKKNQYVTGSLSWKVTKPLRGVKRVIRRK